MKNLITDIDIYELPSRDALLEVLSRGDVVTKSPHSTDYGPMVDMFIELDDVDYEEDPVLSVDFQLIDEGSLIEDEDYTVYNALGYDDLIPNRALARLMNARAEVMVQDTVYKISHRGTYFYPNSYKEEFDQNYASFEESDGVQIDENLYQMSEHVFRYSTFIGDDFTEEQVANATIAQIPYALPWWYQINWNHFPRETISARSWIGKGVESIIGSNKAFKYMYSNNERFYAKFYHFNYFFWQESGVIVKSQRRPFLLWKNVISQKLFAGIHNVAYQMTIPASNPLPQTRYVGSVTERLPFSGSMGETTYIIDGTLSYEKLLQWINSGVDTLFTELRRRTGHDVSRSKAFKIFVDSKIVIYVPDTYVEKENEFEINHNLYKYYYFGFEGLDLLNLPTNLKGWAQSLARFLYNVPKFNLVSGEVRAAAQYNNQIKAVSLYKD